MRALGDGWMLPAVDDSNRDWFTSGRLAFRRCASCSTVQFPPEDVCGTCQATSFDEVVSEGVGRVESVVVAHHPVHPALADAVPYAIVLVSLDDVDGVHLGGNVLGTPPGLVAIGQAVRVAWETVEDPDEPGTTLRIPQWELT
jgi:3-oxo-4,17-pregnadiene-20-carboxyl-CoA hydratase alpha subunit